MSRLLLAAFVVLVPLAPAVAQGRAGLFDFDYRQTELRNVNGHWILYAGQAALKDLGTNESEAREAARLVRDLRLTQHGTIGAPQPVIEYWLSEGRAPQTFAHGHRIIAFHPERLRVAEVQGQWCLCEGTQVMFGFGGQAADAREALTVLQGHGFNRVGYVGAPIPVMMYFLDLDEPEPAARPAPKSTAAPSPPPLALMLPAYQLCVPDQTLTDGEQAKTRIRFDPTQVEAICDGHSWKLTVGGRCLVDFGDRQTDALNALEAVRFYRFTEQCRAGDSATACSYFLVNGDAPRGLMLGVRTMDFRPETVAIRQQGDVWVLCDHGQSLAVVGSTYEEACRAVEVIRRYQFDHVCQLGDPEQPTLTFFVRDH